MQENFHRDVDYHRRRTEDLSSELQLRKVEATSAIEECDRKQSSLNSKDARIVILEAQVRSGGGGGEEGGEGGDDISATHDCIWTIVRRFDHILSALITPHWKVLRS